MIASSIFKFLVLFFAASAVYASELNKLFAKKNSSKISLLKSFF